MPNGKKESAVHSVERSLNILEILSEDEHGLRLTDIAKLAKLPLSTTHRLLTTLEKRKFAQMDANEGVWHIGRQAFLVGSAFLKRHNFVAPALPFLRALRDETKETANLGILQDGEVITLAQAESREIMRAISQVGGRVPVYASGMGKAILSTYTEGAVSDLMQHTQMRQFTETTLKSMDHLTDALNKAREAGYALDDEEYVSGLKCIAAPVYDVQSEAFCAISISGIAARMPEEKIAQLAQKVIEKAAALTKLFGGK